MSTAVRVWVDDDGSNTTGTLIDKATLVDALSAADVCCGRLTLTTALPVTTADVTAATTVYFTPYKGNRIGLYDGTSWVPNVFAEISLALGTVTSGLPYDFFAYDNAGTVTLEKLAWTNGTTRATALVLQDGVLVKTGATTRRYLGTIYTTSTTTTEDSLLKRFVWNYYHRVPRNLLYSTSGTHTYSTATWRQWNATAGAKVEFILGFVEQAMTGFVGMKASNSVGGVLLGTGFGIDSTTAVSGVGLMEGAFISLQANIETSQPVVTAFQPSLGYHYLALLEYATASGTTTWNANSGVVGLTTSLQG